MSFDAGAAGADDSAAAAGNVTVAPCTVFAVRGQALRSVACCQLNWTLTPLAAPRRARFSGSDDLRLLQGVRLYQPYAAEHGRKIRMWEKIAQELRLSTEKMGQVQLTGRAVSDRFQLLLKLHKAGTLRIKSPPATAAELHQVINSMLRDISNHTDEIRASRGKPAKNYGQVTSPEAMRLHSDPEMAASELHVDEEEVEKGAEDVEDGDEAAEGMALLNRLSTKDLLSSSMREDDDALAAAEDADAALPHDHEQLQLSRGGGQQQGHQRTKQQVLTAQLVALETEKLRLKKRKLAMLAQHHEEHMALLRQRLALEERRFHEESASRRQELHLLFERLSEQQQQRSRGNSAASGGAGTAPATKGGSSSSGPPPI